MGKQAFVSLMIVDDHPMWRETLRTVLERGHAGRIVAEAGDGEEALKVAKNAKPQVAIMDIDLPLMSGIEATRRLIQTLPGIKVLVLAASDERSRVLDAVRAGASGYLLKTTESADVVEAVRKIHAGELVFPPALAEVVLGELRSSGDGVPEKTLSLVVAAGEVLFREGLARVLRERGFEVLGLAGDGDELIAMTEASPPDVVVVDRGLKDSQKQGGIAVAEAMKKTQPELGVLVLSEEADASSAVELLSETAKGVGYLLRDRVSDVDQLIDAIRRVASGDAVIDPEVAAGLASRRKARDPLGDLTDREREILALMAEGRSNQAIADRVFLTSKTVETHVGRIFSKLGLEPAADDSRRVLAVLTYLRSV